MNGEYSLPCGICGKPVKYRCYNQIEYHDCKPIPAERMAEVLGHIIGMCGAPDPADACRNIIDKCKAEIIALPHD